MINKGSDNTLNGRAKQVVIEITPQMIEAGITEMRRHHHGESMCKIVEAIYLMMEIERRSQHKLSHSCASSSRRA